MPIETGDIQFYKTQVMDDVPEGGGGPTGIVIPSGTSNAIMPDVSESDRAVGNVRLRKIVLGISTDDTSTFLGSNIILSLPPADNYVSMALFSTGQMFDRREDALARLQAYLNIGTNESALLYGNHIAGQNTLLLYQRNDVLPFIGDTLVLTKREGFDDEKEEYVRVTEASAVGQEFEDQAGVFTRYRLTLKLQNPLENDFGGFNVQRYDYTQEQIALKTKVSNTVVADAASYQGVSPLEENAVISEHTIKVKSIFTQLVPSAQVETPIADARTNQVLASVVAGGGVITQVVNAVFSTTQSLFIGGGIAPGTLSISDGTITLDDTGGRLMNGGTQVGSLDHENGVLSLLSNVFGTGGVSLTIVYAPAAAPLAVNQSMSFPITAEGRANSYVRTIEPPPLPGTLSVSYMSGGRWYVLRDDGSGALRGSSSAFGVGSLNPVSGTVQLTLGALPDVGSDLIYQWAEPEAARQADLLTLDNGGNFYWPFNTSGVSSLDSGAKAIEPGALVITWPDGIGGTKTAVDDGFGNITGDATGTVNYARGTLRLSPNILPARGTVMSLTTNSAAKITATLAVASGVGSFGMTNITPGSVSFDVLGQLKFSYLGGAVGNWGPPATFRITDNGAGVLQLRIGDALINVGTVNYSAGTFAFSANTALPLEVALQVTAFDNVYLADTTAKGPWYTLAAA